MRSVFHLPVILMLAAGAAWSADQPELAKVATEDAGTVDPGAFELAVGIDHAWASKGWDAEGTSTDRGGRARQTDLGVGLKYGVVESLDIGVGVGWSRITDQAAAEAGEPDSGSGLADVDLGLKWRFFQGEDDRLASALTAGVIAPMGRGTAEDAIPVAGEDWALRGGLVATGWIDRLAWSTAVEIVRPLGEAAEETRYEFAWDAAVGWQVTPWLQPELELHHARADAIEGDDAYVWSFTAGVLIPLESSRIAGGWTRDIAGTASDQSDAISVSVTTTF